MSVNNEMIVMQPGQWFNIQLPSGKVINVECTEDFVHLSLPDGELLFCEDKIDNVWKEPVEWKATQSHVVVFGSMSTTRGSETPFDEITQVIIFETELEAQSFEETLSQRDDHIYSEVHPVIRPEDCH